MCGIVGYIGNREGVPILLEGLRRLEYRGYDSAGICLVDRDRLWLRKSTGKIAELEAHIGAGAVPATAGIAHTRWATHGEPNQVNAHPHVGASGDIALVHNGIIDNYEKLRADLAEQGVEFVSQTDSEVLVQLIDHHYDGCLEIAVQQALAMVKGTFGVAIVSAKEPHKIVAARRGSPLVIGVGDTETFIASDVAPLVAHTRQVVYLDDNEMCVVRRGDVTTMTLKNVAVTKSVHEVDWDIGKIERGGFDHFMLKEIYEQPDAIGQTMLGRFDPDMETARLDGLNLSHEDMQKTKRIVFLACGTSWHAALAGEYMLEDLAGIPTEVEYASEFRYRPSPKPEPDTLYVAISQSGETADTLAAMREARHKGGRVVGIVNTVGSTIARENEGGIYLHAGPEIGVASTKAFTCQLMALVLMALKFGRARRLDEASGHRIMHAIKELPDKIRRALEENERIRSIAEEYADRPNFLYLGRGYNFPIALEGALKLKEISYIHAEGYPAAEMKHGPIALIDDQMPVVFIATRDAMYEKIQSNIQEVRARRGRVIVIATEGDEEIAQQADDVIYVPPTEDFLAPILSVVPLQLLAYHIAVLRGCDVDQPRNLAKSVTVE